MRRSVFLVNVAQGSGAIPWETWFPVSIEALDGAAWRNAWQNLSDSQQYAVLEHLRRDGTVFADTLLQLAVRSFKAGPEDPQVRQFLLFDAAAATNRNACALEAHHQELANIVGVTAETQLDLYTRITDLEGRLSAFRARHVSDDYGRMIALQAEVTHLVQCEKRLREFDRPSVERQLRDVRSESASLSAEKAKINGELQVQTAMVTQQRQELSELRQCLMTQQVESARLDQEATATQAKLDRLRQEAVASVAKRENAIRDENRITAQLKSDRELLGELDGGPMAQDSVALAADFDDWAVRKRIIDQERAVIDRRFSELFDRARPDESDAKFTIK